MSLPTGNIPLLVVLYEVTSVEEAITSATCQVCLERKGSIERGLYAVLTALGCSDVQAGPRVDLSCFTPAKKTDRGPSMFGVRVALPKMPDRPSAPFRRPAPPREPSLNDEPRLPKILEKPAVRESESKPEPLRAPLIEADQAQLRELRQRIRAANAVKFQALVHELRVELDSIRSVAADKDVDGAVDALLAKMGEALRIDPDQRGKARLMAHLKTTEEELESLRLIFWATHSIVPKKSSGDGGEGEGGETYDARPHESRCRAVGIKLEEVEENPFPDGRRPRHFSEKGEGRQAMILPVIVVRAKSDLPRVANKPLGEPDDPLPKIVYPEGGRYGKDFMVQWSRIKLKQSSTRAFITIDLALWAADHPESAVPLELVCSYLEPFLDGENEALSESDVASSSEETQPHTEV